MQQFIIYKAEFEDCSVAFPIMYVLNKQYVLIGPEIKKGIQPAISYADFEKFTKAIVGGVECERCIDIWEVLNDNFYFSNVDVDLKKIMSLYFAVARYTGNLDTTPEPIYPLLSNDKYNFESMFVAKCIDLDLSTVDLSQSRDEYFSALANSSNPCKIITEKDFSAACLVSRFDPTIVSKVGVLPDTLENFVKRVELNAKVYGFIHGKPHIGHVNQAGECIDFGHAFNLREVSRMIEYLKRTLPPHLHEKAIEKAKIHDVDVGAACTLLEIFQFIDGLDKTEKILEMQKWILDVLTDYFINCDESIFTYLKNSTFVFEGGFEPEFGLPQQWKPMKEQFPTFYFLEKFFK